MSKKNIDEEIFENEFPFKILFNILFIILATLYIIYHIYNGNYGFKNYLNKQNIIAQKHIDLQKAKKDINIMQKKIEKLQDNNLDSDLLDEEIRKNTGYAKKNEIVIYSSEL